MITLIMRLWVSTEKQQRRGERESNLIWTEEFLAKGIREICRPKEELENKGIIEGKCLKRRVACKHHWNKRLNKTRSILLDLYFKGFVHFHWEMIKTGARCRTLSGQFRRFDSHANAGERTLECLYPDGSGAWQAFWTNMSTADRQEDMMVETDDSGYLILERREFLSAGSDL